MWNAIGAGINAISQTVQGHLNRKQSVKNQNRTIEANKEQAKYAYSKELEMWERANQYNNPASQMARFKDAGLNPALMYGKGSAGAGVSAQTMPRYNAPRIEYNEKPYQLPMNLLGQYQDLKMKSAQIDNVKQQNSLLQMRKESMWWKNAMDQLRVFGKQYAKGYLNKDGYMKLVRSTLDEHGESYWGEDSPFYSQYSGQAQTTQSRATMYKYEADLWKELKVLGFGTKYLPIIFNWLKRKK